MHTFDFVCVLLDRLQENHRHQAHLIKWIYLAPVKFMPSAVARTMAVLFMFQTNLGKKWYWDSFNYQIKNFLLQKMR